MKRKTKIIATLGPAIDSLDSVRQMVGAGMNVARFNFSHGTPEDHARRHEWVRTASSEAGVAVATMQDIQGPKIRVGTFPGGSVMLEQGAEATLEPGEGEGGGSTICIAYLEYVDLEPGSAVLLADGMIRLEVVSIVGGVARVRVVGGGELFDHKGAAFPGSDTGVPVITDKDTVDLAIGREIGFDLIAASFISSGADIREIREHVGYLPIIAKIESTSSPRRTDRWWLEGISVLS